MHLGGSHGVLVDPNLRVASTDLAEVMVKLSNVVTATEPKADHQQYMNNRVDYVLNMGADTSNTTS